MKYLIEINSLISVLLFGNDPHNKKNLLNSDPPAPNLLRHVTESKHFLRPYEALATVTIQSTGHCCLSASNNG